MSNQCSWWSLCSHSHRQADLWSDWCEWRWFGMFTAGKWQKWGEVIKLSTGMQQANERYMSGPEKEKTGSVQAEFWVSHLLQPSLRLREEQTRHRPCSWCPHKTSQAHSKKITGEASRLRDMTRSLQGETNFSLRPWRWNRAETLVNPLRRHRRGRSPLSSSPWRQTGRGKGRGVIKEIQTNPVLLDRRMASLTIVCAVQTVSLF